MFNICYFRNAIVLTMCVVTVKPILIWRYWLKPKNKERHFFNFKFLLSILMICFITCSLICVCMCKCTHTHTLLFCWIITSHLNIWTCFPREQGQSLLYNHNTMITFNKLSKNASLSNSFLSLPNYFQNVLCSCSLPTSPMEDRILPVLSPSRTTAPFPFPIFHNDTSKESSADVL